MIIEQLPQTKTLEFERAEKFGLERIAAYYRDCDYNICEYSLGIKLMCASLYRYRFAEVAGCLICRDEYEGIVYFDYPVVGPDGDLEAALSAIETYCMEKDIPLRYTTLPPSALGLLTARYDGVRLRKTYECRDYCYRTEEIVEFAGKKYAGQRNHVRRFYRQYPNAVFRKMTARDIPALEVFANRFDATFQKRGEDAVNEREKAFAMLRMDRDDLFRIGCMELDGEIIGVALGERCGNVLLEHVEKALSSEYEGLYPALFQAFVATFGSDCTYVNREDDAADRGLRTSKMQYHPAHISQKYDMDVLNLLAFWDEIPTIETDRLRLTAIETADAEAYRMLCTDDAHNRYWGYDYRTDLGDASADGTYFVNVARADFEEKRTLNFAIRADGEFVGETVLYRFDNRGGVELGVRILPAFLRRGYGKEAFEATANWAIYTLGAERVVAKCFRENAASVAMLSSVMRQIDADETMLYFEKRV
ncbi:MAG: GNAT family N-acetyltransferase [Clostridia bacterium]|nr:GNAT family N-acetyltransferase [Clostridia bacterium]